MRRAAQDVREAHAIRLGVARARRDDLRDEVLCVEQTERGRGSELAGTRCVEDDGPSDRGELEQRDGDLASRGRCLADDDGAFARASDGSEDRVERLTNERVAGDALLDVTRGLARLIVTPRLDLD